ncbi:MAG TPA: DinB family protein [Casimicrobiaceae bacterium]
MPPTRRMITSEYCRLMARYNRWMNERLYALCGQMSEVERKRDRGAFFGSIHGTLNHLPLGRPHVAGPDRRIALHVPAIRGGHVCELRRALPRARSDRQVDAGVGR